MLSAKQFWKLSALGLILVGLVVLVGTTQASSQTKNAVGISYFDRIESAPASRQYLYDFDFAGSKLVFEDGVTYEIYDSLERSRKDIYTHHFDYLPIVHITDSGHAVFYIGHANGAPSGATFRYDSSSETSQQVFVTINGQQKWVYASAISGSGNIILFEQNPPTGRKGTCHTANLASGQVITTTIDKNGNVDTTGEVTCYALSSNGNVVLFDSTSSMLVEGDTNALRDIFVYNTMTGKSSAMSVSTAGVFADKAVSAPMMSKNGQYVFFLSLATNLVSNYDVGTNPDLFVRDRATGKTDVVRLSSLGADIILQTYDVSDDGRFVVFASNSSNVVENDTNNQFDVFIHDRSTGTTTPVSVNLDGQFANGSSNQPVISGDAKIIAFQSNATNLTSGDTNNRSDIYIFKHEFEDITPTPTPTPTSNPDAKQVVVFIPGIAGSQLVREQALLPDEYVWPALRDYIKEKMRLKPATQDEPSTRDNSIYTDDVIRSYFLFPIYGPFLNRLDDNGYTKYETQGDPNKRRQNGCDKSQTNATLFVFPWDWRYGAVDAVKSDGQKDSDLSLTPNNTELLAEYIQCVLLIHPDAEITLVTHSMGWFLGRTYVLNNVSNHHIVKHIAIAPPRLGAPDTLAMMLTGNWLPELISKDLTRTLLEHFPGAHQLLPSKSYWEVYGSPWQLKDHPLLPDGDVKFEDFQSVLQSYYVSPAEDMFYRSSVPFVDNMKKVYENPAFADLNNDNTGVTYEIVYGVLNNGDPTTGKIVDKALWTYNQTLLGSGREYNLIPTSGDGTVPEASAAAKGNGHDLNGNFVPHKLVGSRMEHQAMMNQPRLQDCVLALLKGDICNSDVSTAAGSQSLPARYIKLWGVDEIYVTDGISTTQNLMTTTLTLEMFPEVSAKYSGNHSIMLTVKGNKRYTVNFTGQGEYFESESQYGTGDSNRRVIRFSPEPATGQHLALVTTLDELAEMQVDTNGDGIADTKVEPLADLQGEVANDTTPPVVSTSYESTTGLVVTAIDTESGVESISYTVDGTHFQPYREPVIFTNQSITNVTVIAQDKAGNLSNHVSVPVTVIASNSLYLPLITR